VTECVELGMRRGQIVSCVRVPRSLLLLLEDHCGPTSMLGGLLGVYIALDLKTKSHHYFRLFCDNANVERTPGDD